MKVSPLGSLEREVMEVVWNCGKCSVRDVHKKLLHKRKIAYTTVATILQRLCDKDLLRREHVVRSYLYCPRISREKYSKNLARSFLKKFIDSFGNIAIASFADSIEHLPRKKKEYFLKLLEKHAKLE